MRLQPGLLGNPQNAGVLHRQQQFQADSCPADSKVGSVVIATSHILADDRLPTTNNGDVYNLRPTGDRAGAGRASSSQPRAALSKIFLQSPVFMRPGADGYGLESTFADQPRELAGIPIQITKVALTFNGRASKGSFMRMPTSCAQGTSLSRAELVGCAVGVLQKTFTMTPTGCNSLGFSPTAEGSMGAPGLTHREDGVPVSHDAAPSTRRRPR